MVGTSIRMLGTNKRKTGKNCPQHSVINQHIELFTLNNRYIVFFERLYASIILMFILMWGG